MGRDQLGFACLRALGGAGPTYSCISRGSNGSRLARVRFLEAPGGSRPARRQLSRVSGRLDGTQAVAYEEGARSAFYLTFLRGSSPASQASAASMASSPVETR